MADDQTNPTTESAPLAADQPPAEGAAPAKKAAARKTAAKKAPAKKATTRKTAAKKTASPDVEAAPGTEPGDTPAPVPAESAGSAAAEEAPAQKTATKAARRAPAKRTTKKVAATQADPFAASAEAVETPEAPAAPAEAPRAPAVAIPLFKVPDPTAAPVRRARKAAPPAAEAPVVDSTTEAVEDEEATPEVEPAPRQRSRSRQGSRQGAARKVAEAASADEDDTESVTDPAAVEAEEEPASGDTDVDATDAADDGEDENGGRRRRRRGGRRRRKPGEGDSAESEDSSGEPDAGQAAKQDSRQSGRQDSRKNAEKNAGPDDSAADQDDTDGDGTSRRRRRRRRTGEDGAEEGDSGTGTTVTRVRKPRSAEDEITSISGSTRLEAKKQRRREGREAGRRRAPIVSEAEFLARRESVERVMVIRQRDDLTQIGVLEDKVLVEHYVARESQTSLIGNVYLGRVQNVLPSMEAAFIDIGKGRNAVLYAGEVNWSALGHRDGQPRKIESVLSSGQSILVQVTKDPIGNKGARLSSQVSLAGRFLVYVPDGTTSGISRKLPDTERGRLKALLKELVPDTAGVIVRTAAEGASEDELTRDVERLRARWEDIEGKVKGSAPQLLYGEPDLTLKVVRDLFTEDFGRLVIQGDDAWDTVQQYVSHVAPDLEERLERFEPGPDGGKDIFATYRVDEQITKGLDRKVFLPSGGSLVIDRTEAMTVVDVNTGKFTGSGGNLEETVTKNNLEAAEEMVRQLRLRDIGGIIVVDFIDMVLESNRDLVLRRLVECLGRDRTRHQVAEVTSLGLVQMTRKRIGTGLVESFSHNCEHCQGRGVVIQDSPVEPASSDDDYRRGGGNSNSNSGGNGGSSGNSGGGRRGRGGRGRGDDQGNNGSNGAGSGRSGPPSPMDVAAMAKPENAGRAPIELDELDDLEELTDRPGADVPAVSPDPGSVPDSPVEQEPKAPEPPRVVTRTRRRAGSATAQATPEQVSPQEAAPTVVAPELETETETVVEPSAPEPPKVVTRTRRRATRPAGQVEPAQAEPDHGVPQVEAQSVLVAEPETVVEPSAPQPPKVVTRQRRAATRPVGQPDAVTAEPVTIPTSVVELATAPVVEAAAPVEPPRVVTRTRRVAATRPSGPPAGPEAAAGTGPADGENSDEAEPPVVEHVPVKKKGSRKR